MNGLDLANAAIALWRSRYGDESLYLQCQRFDGFYTQWAWTGGDGDDIQAYYNAKAAAQASKAAGRIYTYDYDNPEITAGEKVYYVWDEDWHVCSVIGRDAGGLLVTNTANAGDVVLQLDNHVKVSHAHTLGLELYGISSRDGVNPHITGVEMWTPGAPTPVGPRQRVVGAGGARGRIEPTTESAKDDDAYLDPGDLGNFDGWRYGETVDGINVWIRGAYRGRWYWIGSFNDQSVHDLPDLNPVAPKTSRTVASGGTARVRKEPWKTSEVTSELTSGTEVQIIAWANADDEGGNTVWYQHAAGWSWSGGFTSQSTDGLQKVDAPRPVDPTEPPVTNPDNPRGLAEYTPVYPGAKKGLVAPLGFDGGDPKKPMLRTTKNSPPVAATPIIDRYIVHHTGTTKDQLEYFSYLNDRSSCPTWYMRTDGSVFEMIRPRLKPAASGPSWNWRSVAVETQNETGAPAWSVTDAQLEKHAQMVAWLAEFDGKELDGIPVAFKIDREHVIGHDETGFSTECPGPYLRAHLDSIVARAKAIWAENHPTPEPGGGVKLTREFIEGQIFTLESQVELWKGLLK